MGSGSDCAESSASLGINGRPVPGEHAKVMQWVNGQLGCTAWLSVIPDVPWNPPLRVEPSHHPNRTRKEEDVSARQVRQRRRSA